MAATSEPSAARDRAPVAGRFRERAAAEPLDVADVAANVPFVLRTVLGISGLAIGANVTGVVVLVVLLGALNSDVSHQQARTTVTAAGVMLIVSVGLGVTAAVLVQRRTLRWLLRGEPPDATGARRALRLPLDMAVIAFVLWTLGTAATAAVTASVGIPGSTVAPIAAGVFLAGLSSAGVTYLLVGRVSQPIALVALAASPPRTAPVLGVRWRLLLLWVLTSGLPLLGLILLFAAPQTKSHVVAVSTVLCVVAVLVGMLSTGLAARAIGAPLRNLVLALDRVARGDLETAVPIEDAGEIGLVQNGFNDMVAGLRERDRVTDLFGRHVGSSVAQQALRSGVTLSGESREVVAVFVDITGSTALSRTTDPAEFVAMLNRFFAIVVDEVERGGGLLNKFEGDAALCVFGAPTELIDPASSALRAARRIRDRVFAAGEVEVGVGVATGPVVAGQVGTQSRLEFTVIGDAVNEAARLTDLAKQIRQHLLASAAVLERATADERERWTPNGEVVLRGRDVLTRTWTA